ncbi:hypothetical protein N6O45_22190, partial [Escherichia coli]|nr:hypothetical protein [Escherichia coli]
SDGNGSHASTLKSPSYTKSVSWQHYQEPELAKAWIFANLLAAFLIDDIIQPSLDFPPRSAGSEKKN